MATNTDSSEQPVVNVVSTGGTIASTEEAADEEAYKNYSLSQDADDLVASVPLLDEFVDVEIEEVTNKESPKLLIEDHVEIAKTARRAERTGSDGVIVTHGTSAIEETAYFCDLVLDLAIPVVFVGAMRPADAVDADGPANILTAARLIASDAFQTQTEQTGVYVVLNETIHAARDVTKSDTWATESFDSGPAGPIGRFTDEEIQLYREPDSYSADLSDCDLDAATEMTVPIVTTGAGVEGTLIKQALSGDFDADGFVIQTTGRGGTSPGITNASTEAIDAGIPVASSSRCYYGPLMSSSEPETIIPMEDLAAWKARIQLIVLLTLTTDIEKIRDASTGSKYGRSVTSPAEI